MADQNPLLTPNANNWLTGGGGLYALALYDIEQNRTPTPAELKVAIDNKSTALEFTFKMPPKSISPDEPASVTIIPTQGGQYIEHQGQIFKNITISGTTGLRPSKNLRPQGNLFDVINPVKNLLEDQIVPEDEETGFDAIIKLKNLFRIYYNAKLDPELASRIVMVWRNYREEEYWIVEPMNLRTPRNSSSPYTTEYEITLRTIEPIVGKRPADPVGDLNSAQNRIANAQAAIQKLVNYTKIAESIVDRAATVGLAVTSLVLIPAKQIIENLTGTVTAANRVASVPTITRKQVSDLKDNCISLGKLLDSDSSNPYTATATISEATTMSNALKNMSRALVSISSQPTFFANNYQGVVSRKIGQYGTKRSGGSPTNLVNAGAPNFAAEAYVNDGDDIRSLAQRLLGDAARYKEIVLLNNLRQPYISIDGDGVNVLRPGDKVLYPIRSNNPETYIAPNKNRQITTANPLDELLGTDLKLSNGRVRDLLVGSDGDLAMIRGLDNMKQAINIKFDTEQGELPTHPTFGGQFSIGTKAKMKSIIGYHLNIRSTLLSDKRITNIGSISTVVEGNALKNNASVILVGASQTLPINFNIQG